MSSTFFSGFYPPESSEGVKGSAAFPLSTQITLSSDSIVVPANSDGTSTDLTGASTTVTILEAGEDVTDLWTITPVASSGLTFSVVGNTYTITDLDVTRGTITFNATRTGYTTLTTVFSISKALAGVNGVSGTDAISGLLTNEATTLFTYANGVVVSYGPATGQFKVFSGTTDISSSFTLSTVSNPQSLSVSYVGQTYSVTGGFDPSEDTATLTIRATGSGDWLGVILDKTFTLSKSKGGFEIVSSLPGVGDPRRFEGSIVFLTTDDKLYRFNGTSWTAAVPAADISGEITNTQIGDDAIQTRNVAAFAITAAEIGTGSILADKIATNAVTADKIQAGAVTAAKINVTDLSAITANVGTLTAGTIRNGADTFRVDVTNGRSITQTGAFMKVTGNPFGSSNQFIEWYGPYFTSLSSCTEANAVYYLKTDGSAYFGGNLSAGILKTAVQTSSLASDASVETGNYGSNGGTIQIILSYYAYSASPQAIYPATTTGRNNFNAAVTAWGATPTDFVNASKSVSATVAIALDRSVNGGAFTNGVATLNIATGTETLTGFQPVPGDSSGYIEYTRTFSGSLTYTDPQTVAQNRNYRARITSRASGILAYSLNQQQRVGIVSTE